MASRPLPILETPPPVRAASRAPVPVAPALDEFATDAATLPRFHVWSLGCQMNASDAEEMAGALLAAGCIEAPVVESADLIIINTCAIRETAEAKVIGRQGQLARLKAANPALRVVLTGCAVRAENRDRLPRRYPAVDLFLRPDEEPELTARLGLAGPTAPGSLSGPDRSPIVVRRAGGIPTAAADRLPAARATAVAQDRVARRSATHAWLPIIYGCDKTCTYCIVPFSRGPERSRPFDEVIAEAERLAAAGFRDVTLLGQNVNSYGHDLPAEARFSDVRHRRSLGLDLDLDGRPDIAALLRAIDGIRTADGRAAIPRLRFITSHPWDLGERLIQAIAECASVCEHLHLPVQSGSDAVLQRMGRQYTMEAYVNLVERLRAAVPGICLTTDVIVGFCGESEAQFEQTLNLLDRVGFDAVYAAAFSPRPGTPAARLADDVPAAEKRRRLNALLAFQEGIGLRRNETWVGLISEVLVDQVRPPRHHQHDEAGEGTQDLPPQVPELTGAVRPATEQPGAVRLAGRNRANKLVHFDGPAEFVGRFVDVRIERAGPYALAGSLAAAQPR